MQHTTDDSDTPSDAQTPSEAPARTERLAVPPWIQLVGLPLLVIFSWKFAGAASHAVVVFLIATLISLLLNPVVRWISSLGVPRALSVLSVLSIFMVIIVVITIATVDTVATQAQHVRANLPTYGASVERQIERLQNVLDRRNVGINLRDEGIRFVTQLEAKSTELSTQALDFGRTFVQSAAAAIFNLILVFVVTIYMLLDAPRIGRFISSITPRDSNVEVLFQRLERSLIRYVVGQTMASIVMGVSAMVGLYVIGLFVWPEVTDLIVIFGLIVAVTEFAPSIGPVIGSIPPIIAAAFAGPVPLLVTALFFLALHQVEGHIVIPKLVGAAIAVHPLLVIFGIVAGAQIMGIGGILLALPLLAMGREIVLFVRERVQLGSWPTAPNPVMAGSYAEASNAGVTPRTTPTQGARRRTRVRQKIKDWRSRTGDESSNEDDAS